MTFLHVFILVSCKTPTVQSPAPKRIIAIGDLHADLQSSLQALRLAGAIDAQNQWIAQNTVVVQTGDLTDRGADGKEVLQLIQNLEQQAARHNSTLITLIGNHEAMNLLGDWRYVSSSDIEGFGGQDARIKAFSDSGEWYQWIIKHDAVVKVGDNVFVHGGVTPEYAQKGIEAINKELQESLKSRRRSPILGENGPLWFRGYLREKEEIICPKLSQALKSLKARRMIVGHTTQRSGKIAVRCAGRLIGIDTGISSHYGAHTAVLELSNDDARALYPTGYEDIPDPK